jgi:hypothetical protein
VGAGGDGGGHAGGDSPVGRQASPAPPCHPGRNHYRYPPFTGCCCPGHRLRMVLWSYKPDHHHSRPASPAEGRDSDVQPGGPAPER